MTTRKATAHVAGAIYALLVVSGMIALLYVPEKLIVAGDIAATISRISASETLYRFGILSAIVCQLCYVVLPLVLYRLFEEVDRKLALVMIVLVLVSVPISFISISNSLDVLALVNGTKGLSALAPADIGAQVALKLAAADHQTLVAEVFWGLWLMPFGMLIYRSGFLPKILGVFLMLGCLGYLVQVVSQVMWPVWFKASGVAPFVSLPSGVGEIGTCLWLLIMGAKEKGTS